MPRKFPPVAAAEEIRTIAQRAFAVLDELRDDDGDNSERAQARWDQAYRMAKDALRFCASTAAVLGDNSLVPLILRVVEAQEEWDEHAPDDQEAVEAGLAGLLANRAAPAPQKPGDFETIDEDLVLELAPLASDPEWERRARAAVGLRPTSPRAIALLERLAQDPVLAVRAPSKKSLTKVREVPWWWGKLSGDPAIRLEPAELEAHGPTLAALSELLDLERRALAAREEELVSVLGALPDALAIDAAEMLLSGNEKHGPQFEPIGTLLVSRPGGAEAFARLCEAWGHDRGFYNDDKFAKMVAGAPREARLAVCMHLARFACTQPDEARRDHDSGAYLAAKIAARAFPVEEAVDPLIALVLDLPPADPRHGNYDYVGLTLGDVLRRPGAKLGEALLERMIEARLAAYPGSFMMLRTAIDALLCTLPRERLRPVAEAAVRSDDEHTVAFGLTRLCLEAYDPANDPEPAELLRRFCEDPRLLRVIAADHELPRMAVPWLRERLRAGSLDFEQASKVADAVHALWGGKVDWDVDSHLRCAAEQEKRAAFLGPVELQGPFTEAEWAALRRARALTMRDERREMFRALLILPAGPTWDPEDEALFARAKELLISGERDLAWPMAVALGCKPSLEKLPLFDLLIAHASEGEDDDAERIRECRTQARARLGLPLEPEPEEDDDEDGAKDPASMSWMDEEDD
jgi:hypothetical protein